MARGTKDYPNDELDLEDVTFEENAENAAQDGHDAESVDDEDDFWNEDDQDDDGYDEDTDKKKSKGIDIIRYFILVAAAITFIVAVYMLADIFLEYKKGVDIYESIGESVLVPVEKATGDGSKDSNQEGSEALPFVYDHDALLAINPEGQGYLYIPSIDLRLPIVQGTDNEYYLNHTFNKVYNGAGALFIDSRIENGISGSNVIIYGHNMKNGSMFAGLTNYKNESFYNQSGNDVFYIYTGDKVREYRIFSAFENDPQGYVYTCNFKTPQQLQEYAGTVKSYSLYDTKVDVSQASQVVTFSTCTSDGERRIVVQGIYVGERAL